jgi:aromatic ring hydroxylase
MTTTPTKQRSPLTGQQYLDSLADGRTVWIYGERVASVTDHPAFANTAAMIARLYDALRAPDKRQVLTCETDTPTGSFTHRFFRAARSVDDLVAARDAIAEWARMTYGWMGRSPDYKAAFFSTLGANADFYSPYYDNAQRWYHEAQDRVLYMCHAVVDPPIDRHLSAADGAQDIRLRVVRETDAGPIISGAKTVATNAALSQYGFIAQLAAVKQKEQALVFVAPLNAPGLKMLCRPSYQMTAQRVGSPFDYPLSSRLDENDTVLVFDDVLIPWENMLVYRDTDKLQAFLTGAGFEQNTMFHGCTRLAVKIDFIAGLLLKALEITGAIQHRNVQVHVGEVLGWRNMLWSLTEAMARAPSAWRNGTVLPNNEAGLAYLAIAPGIYSKVREMVENLAASGLIFITSHARDFAVPEIRRCLDRYMRGSNGTDAVERNKVMKLLWDAVGSEFASRHDLYEHNYAGNFEFVRWLNYAGAQAYGQAGELKALAERCMSEYDLDGWRVADLKPGRRS